MAIQDSGSNYQFYDKQIKAHVSRSAFDISRLHTTTLDLGQIVPVDMIFTLPGDDFDIKIEHLIRAMPMVVPLMSRMRVFFHTYYMSYAQLWNHWHMFMSKGRTGKYTATFPTITLSADVTAGSLANYLGLPVGLTVARASFLKINALPFLMYQRIYRDYYLNANLHTSDTYWFPDDEDSLRLTDGAHQYLYDSDQKIQLDKLRYRDFVNDYFTSSLPFPMRGDTPSIGLAGNARVVAPIITSGYSPLNSAYRYDVHVPMNNGSGSGTAQNRDMALRLVAVPLDGSTSSWSQFGTKFHAMDSQNPNGYYETYVNQSGTQTPLNGAREHQLYADLSTVSAVTLDQLRELVVAQRLMEKMARTDGSYGQFVKTFFDEHPKSAKDYRAVYIGGTYAPIVTTEVLQTGETGTTPQGTMTGHGISSADGYIGHFHSDDYGIIMTVASIMPDSMYCQGIERDWTRRTQEEFYLPERAQLGPQAILNKELYAFGANPNDLFAYQDRFDEYRYRQNVVSGKVSDPDSLSFFPYTQARLFQSEPTLSQSFVTTENNIRHDAFFAGSLEVPFIMQVASKVRAVRPLPYKSVPSGFGMA